MILHVSNIEHIRNEGLTMHASIRRERMTRNETEEIVGRRDGRGRGCHADGS